MPKSEVRYSNRSQTQCCMRKKTSPPQSCPRTYWTLQNKCALLLWQHFVDPKWSTITLEIFFATLLPRRMFFILYLYISFLPHKCSTFNLFSLNFILLISSSPFNFSRSFWILVMPFKVHPSPPSSVSPANFISIFPIPLLKLLMKLLNKSRSRADPCRTSLEMPSQYDKEPR